MTPTHMKTRGRWDGPGPRLSDSLREVLSGSTKLDPAWMEDTFAVPTRRLSSANAFEATLKSDGAAVNSEGSRAA